MFAPFCYTCIVLYVDSSLAIFSVRKTGNTYVCVCACVCVCVYVCFNVSSSGYHRFISNIWLWHFLSILTLIYISYLYNHLQLEKWCIGYKRCLSFHYKINGDKFCLTYG